MTSRFRKNIAVAALTVALALPGCAALQRSHAPATEQLLAAAGFRMRPADTPERLAHLKTMPPYKVVSQSKDGQVVYTYADPERCKCVWVGGPEEYSAYERLAVEKRIAQDQVWAAQQWSTLWPWWNPWW